MVAIRRNTGRELIFLFLATEARLAIASLLFDTRGVLAGFACVIPKVDRVPSENKSIG